jgi:hypothetical protein
MVGHRPGRQRQSATAAPSSPFQFDLEEHLKSPSERKKHLKKVEQRIAEIRDQLRAGGSQESFDHLTIMLKAFTALKKVIEHSKAGG